ncbi:MAG: transaldolase [Gemmatimonadota bacterium]|nr:transaldolase [Gemmatimonadota bacterium]
MNALQELWNRGQSFWLDNLSRDMIGNGELARRVAEEGLRGVTSNPAIFHKAITEGEEYDESIAAFGAAGLSVVDAYERLVVADVQAACDILRPVWVESEGLDGYVSLEVSPHLASDSEGTLSDAVRLAADVDRSNLLVKIPGTPQGVPAIRQAVFEGVSVNVTLLFSIAAYDAIAEAYVEGLEQRLDAGRRVDDVASVASFFLSRIDSLTDSRLESLADAHPERADEIRDLLGQAAVANAKLAYQSFQRRLAGDRWGRLAAAGARPQRMLWASTSTKNPAYDDVKYVEPLIGDLTINTMPESTIDAFLDHGVVADTVADGMDEASATMARLGAVGIDFDDITDTLLSEGIEKFVVPFDRLLESLEQRLGSLVAG